MADIIEIMKKAAMGAFDNSSPTSILFGIVKNINPLEIQVDQKTILTKEFLILTKNVIDYEVDVSINWETENKTLNANHSHNVHSDSTVSVDVQNIDLSHNHNISGKKRIKIHNSLKMNDRIILVQQQGGQKFVVLDKIY